MLQIAVPIGFFTAIIVMLAALVLVVRQKLVAREQVELQINNQRYEITSGDTLLETLGELGVELPAACGGRGACGQCRVVIAGQSGELTPAESNHINRRDALSGCRLACMVKVYGDMAVQVPASVLHARRLECKVASVESVSTYLRKIVLEVADGEPFTYQAGDYVLVEAPPATVEFSHFDVGKQYEEAWQRNGLRTLRVEIPEPTTRAYSLANPPSADNRLMLVVRIALAPVGRGAEIPPGMVSSYIFSLQVGDKLTISGPFGTFHAEPAGPRDDEELIFIGGGAGIAPLRSIILDQLVNGQSKRRMSFWYGSRNLRELCFAEEFTDLAAQYENFTYRVALSEPEASDGWTGAIGFIHNVVYEEHLRAHPRPEQAHYYLCGPPLMSAATLAMLEDLGVDRASVHFDDFGGEHVD